MTPDQYELLDYRKLNSEVNQIVSQRFQLTTASIVLLTAVLGWITSRIKLNNLDTLNLACSFSIFLLAALFALFYYFHSLLGPMRIFTTYLSVKHESAWEKEWRAFREDPKTKTYAGYSKLGRFIFLFLGAVAFLYPQILLFFSPEESGHSYNYWCSPMLWIALAAFIVYASAVLIIIWKRHNIINESTLVEDWKRIIGVEGAESSGVAKKGGQEE